MREITCKQCGATVTAKDDKALVNAVKAHFKKEHVLLPVTDGAIADTVKKDAHTVK